MNLIINLTLYIIKQKYITHIFNTANGAPNTHVQANGMLISSMNQSNIPAGNRVTLVVKDDIPTEILGDDGSSVLIEKVDSVGRDSVIRASQVSSEAEESVKNDTERKILPGEPTKSPKVVKLRIEPDPVKEWNFVNEYQEPEGN